MKVCRNCGVQLADYATFCDACGAQQPTPQRVVAPRAYQPVQRRAYQPVQRRAYQPSEAEGWDPLRLGIALLIIGFLLGVGVGAVVFNVMAGPGSSTTTTQRATPTSLVTTSQQPPTTQTPFVTVTQTSPQTAITTSPQATVTTSMTTPAATGGWREIKRFTGSADMTTDPFNIPATAWRIRWSYSSQQATSFSFFVYEVGQSAYVGAVSSYTLGASAILNISKGQSNFYLAITTSANYEIIIEVPA